MSSQQHSPLSEQLSDAAKAVRVKSAIVPRVGLILGSGLGPLADTLEEATALPYAEVPHMPMPKVEGHAGHLCLGKLGGVPVACLRGRVHLYEGHSMSRAVFGARLLAKLGCFAVLVTNAAGGVRTSYRPGTLMLIADHLNLMGDNPLIGPNDDAVGPRFPDMTRAYDPQLAALARDAAAAAGVRLEEGVYAAMRGPSYETPAEIRMLRTIGADAVGMSTVPEVIALRHSGVRVGGVSCITNMAAGMTASLLNHAEVEETASRTRATFAALMAKWVEAIGAADSEAAPHTL